MKRLLPFLIVLFVVASLQAQNLQVHYDFGKTRKLVTSTVEMFKPDKWGSTFFFIDMNYDVNNGKTMSLAYWEIARGIKLGKSPFAAHVEYNGGFGQFNMGSSYGAYQINDAWLTVLTIITIIKIIRVVSVSSYFINISAISRISLTSLQPFGICIC